MNISIRGKASYTIIAYFTLPSDDYKLPSEIKTQVEVLTNEFEY